MPAHLIDGFANLVSWVVIIVLPITLIALFWFVHIWPDTVAKRRQHPQRDAIHALCVLSLFFGGLLWPFAYLWAYTRPTMYKLAYGTDQYSPVNEADSKSKPESSNP
jgi:Na+/H+ antiporter NhaD/arsenite permease-like protein